MKAKFSEVFSAVIVIGTTFISAVSAENHWLFGAVFCGLVSIRFSMDSCTDRIIDALASRE